MKKEGKIAKGLKIAKFRRMEKKLIKSDDETVVEALTKKEDNSNFDIQKIVSKMDKTESRVEVINSNLTEIIDQNNVRDTLKLLPDESIAKIVEENKDKLKEREKIANAILSIKNNKKKLEYLERNLGDLTDMEVQRILKSLKTEKNRKDQSDIEKQQVVVIGKKIFENMKKYGSVFHLAELTECLADEAKKDLFYCCLKIFVNSENSDKLQPNCKSKFVEKYSYLVDLDWDRYVEENLISSEEVVAIEEEKQRKYLNKESKRKVGNSR